MNRGSSPPAADPAVRRPNGEDAMDAGGAGAGGVRTEGMEAEASPGTGETEGTPAGAGTGEAANRARNGGSAETADPSSPVSARRGLGVAAKLYIGLGAAFALTLAASLVGGYSFLNVGEAQRRITERSIPDLDTAFQLAEQGAQLLATAPRLIASDTDEAHAEARAEFEALRSRLGGFVESLEGTDLREGLIEEMNEVMGNLIDNLEWIDRSVERRLGFARDREAMAAEIIEVIRAVDAMLLLDIDDQVLFVATGYRTLEDPPAPPEEHLSYEELSRFRNLLTLSAQSNLGGNLLGQVLQVGDLALIRPLHERFGAVTRKIENALRDIENPELRTHLERLVGFGTGKEDAFRLRESELRLVGLQEEYLTRNLRLESQLVDAAQEIVDAARSGADAAATDSAAAIRLGLGLLFALNVVGIVAVVLIGWLLVGRMLVRRITSLAASMRYMAGGHLETEVDVGGHDEVTDMADALEVFRRHALEVQRLNLVEKLAEEVQAKNVELESVLADLQRAQDQVVLQEKLAALGQLTAGVAHEIKNPLNFIKNFSEISRELTEEMKEILDEGGEGLEAKTREELDDVAGELDTSLGKIVEHSLRADSIVRGMLSHSRESSGELEPVEVNGMLTEFANLAYHSRRALDSEFNVTFHHELDEEVGEIQAVPQDMSRVFLNLVTNACQATDERRKGESDAYKPTLWLKTRREGDMVEVRVRDNGPGIPDHVRAKIFEPFFTTKPTNEGTGLGLSISNDVVRRHGGELRVETEEGEFTEFILRLPRRPEGGAGPGAGNGAPVSVAGEEGVAA